MEIGERVKVVREYDHPTHTTCYRGRVGVLEWTNGKLFRINFSKTGDSARPDLAQDTRHFTRAQLRVIDD